MKHHWIIFVLLMVFGLSPAWAQTVRERMEIQRNQASSANRQTLQTLEQNRSAQSTRVRANREALEQTNRAAAQQGLDTLKQRQESLDAFQARNREMRAIIAQQQADRRDAREGLIQQSPLALEFSSPLGDGSDSPTQEHSSPSQSVAEPTPSPSVANGNMQNGKDNLDLPSADIAQKSTSLWDYIKDQWQRSNATIGDARSKNPQLPSPEESADIMHVGLAVCGTSPVPILSQICDISDGVLYLFENNKTDAALSFGSAIPIWGVLAETGRAAKLVSKTTKATPRAKTITKAESDVWKKLESFRDDIKTDGVGRSKRYYQWDHTHGNIEVYNRSGKHAGVMSAETGKMIGDAVPGRTISL